MVKRSWQQECSRQLNQLHVLQLSAHGNKQQIETFVKPLAAELGGSPDKPPADDKNKFKAQFAG